MLQARFDGDAAILVQDLERGIEFGEHVLVGLGPVQLLLGAVESLEIDPSDSETAAETLDRLREELQRTLDAYLETQKRIFSQSRRSTAAVE